VGRVGTSERAILGTFPQQHVGIKLAPNQLNADSPAAEQVDPHQGVIWLCEVTMNMDRSAVTRLSMRMDARQR
jgi:hypothetical protein